MFTLKYIQTSLVILFLFFFFVALFPYVPTVTYSYYDHHRVFQVSLLAFTSVLFFSSTVASTFKRGSLKSYPLLIGAFLVFGALSSFMSAEPIDSLMHTLHWLMLFVLMATATLLSDRKHLKLLMVGVVVIHSSVVLVSLLNLSFAIFNGDQLVPHVIYYGFDNIRFFNQVQVFVLPILLISLGDSRFKNIVMFLLFANLLLIFVGGGRGALVTWGSVLVCVFILNSRLRHNVGLGVFFTLLAALVFLIIDRYLASSAYGLRLEGSSSGRMEMWMGALEGVNASGMLYGNGPGLFAYRLNNLIFSHPHNSLVEILNEWGGGALLVLLFMVVSALVSAIKYVRANQQDIVTFTVFCSWLSGVGYSLVSGVTVMPVAQTLLFLSWGLLLGRLCKASDVNRLESPRKLILVALVLIIVCVVVYLLLVYQSYTALDEFKPAMQGPRFWLSGDRVLSGWLSNK